MPRKHARQHCWLIVTCHGLLSLWLPLLMLSLAMEMLAMMMMMMMRRPVRWKRYYSTYHSNSSISGNVRGEI